MNTVPSSRSPNRARPAVVMQPSVPINWLNIGLFLFLSAIALGAGVLHVTRAKSTPIDISVLADTVSLLTGEDEVALPAFLVDEITLLGSGKIDGIAGIVEYADQLSISRNSDTAITIQQIVLAPSTVISVRHVPGDPKSFEFLLAPKLEAEAGKPPEDTTMTLLMAGDYQYRNRHNLNWVKVPAGDKAGPPRAIRMTSADGQRAFRVKLVGANWTFRQAFKARGLSVFDDRPGRDGAPSMFSSLLSGSISFEELSNDETLQLRPGQPLRIGAISEGYVRNFMLGANGISIDLFANVSSLTTEWGQGRDHMPTILKVIAQNKYVVSTVAIFGFVVSLLSLFGIGKGKP